MPDQASVGDDSLPILQHGLSWLDAEADCRSQAAHLPSFTAPDVALKHLTQALHLHPTDYIEDTEW